MLFNFVQKRRWFYTFSGVLLLIGFIAMIISMSRFGAPVRLGIDFTGGSLFELQFNKQAGATGQLGSNEITKAFTDAGTVDVSVQQLGSTNDQLSRWQVRTRFVEPNGDLNNRLVQQLSALATSQGYALDETFFRTNQQTVSPTIGSEVTLAAFVATIAASGLILFYIWLAFRQIPHSFRYGASAVLAMIHDILILTGAMSVFGLIFGWEADSLFLTALLTVVGYSIQDTIVVFDRIRENTQRHRTEPYETIVNRSIVETIQRSLTTQLAVIFVLSSLVLMGSGSIRQFVTVLLVGLLSGTYSSLFVAIPLLVSWEKGELPLVNRQPQHA